MIFVPLRLLASFNTPVLRFCRTLGWMALALMVVVTLLQVFMRYALNSAMAWPDEAARFLMLWMTGLMAPSAFRWGGFVAIEMLPEALPRRLGLGLHLALLLVALAVLVVGLVYGWGHAMGFGGNFNSSSLRIPLDWVGGEMVRVKLRYMYASLLVGIGLMTLVCVELILRNLAALTDPDRALPDNDRPASFAPEAE